jgi:drug/metabolite transporter (DMT)-like permease
VIPVVGLLLGTLILGERLDLRHVGGMALIAAGLLVLDGRLAHPRRPARARQPA